MTQSRNTLFARIAADCLVLERHIPPEHTESFRRVRQAALRHAVVKEAELIPDMLAAANEGHLADVIDLGARRDHA